MTATPPPVRLAAIGLNHDHIYGMAAHLVEAGAEMAAVHAVEPELREPFAQRYPAARIAATAQEIYADESIDVVLTAAIPSERAGIAMAAMQHGKDVQSDKAGMTTLAQWQAVRDVQAATGRIYSVAYSERFGSKATVRALELVKAGAVGDVVHLMGTGPHSLRKPTRPDWFFHRDTAGGILCDIAAHQCDQYLAFSGETDPIVVKSQVANRAHPDTPEFEDFGDMLVRGRSTVGYFRVDWFTPAGLASWGDTRLTIVGTEGYIEVRKNLDLAGRAGGDHLFVTDANATRYEDCSGVRLTFGHDFLADVRNRTETAMPQEHCFKAMHLALTAQARADRI